jgi:hypothetical protein
MNISGSNTTSNSALSNNTKPNIRMLANHKYIINVIGCKKSVITAYSEDTPVVFESSESGIITVSTDANVYFRAKVTAGVSDVNEDVFCGITDLTKMFRASNEPSTVEEFYERIPMGIDLYAYNECKLLSVNVESIVTNGFNQWDEQWELGNFDGLTGAELSATNRIRNKNYIPVVGGYSYHFTCLSGDEMGVFAYDENMKYIGVYNNGMWRPKESSDNVTHQTITLPLNCYYIRFRIIPSYGKTYNNDICINLSHSGVRDGEYEPYEEHTQGLPEIARYFPDGMKSVGVVFDEMNEHEAVQRVGQRAYSEGDNDNPAVMTDGVNTVYPLDKPIVTPMPARAINLNYPVWDWGTERAVSDAPSAPFRADIIYGFNAVDTIRTNKLNIEDILRRLAELEAKAVVEQSVEE